MSPEPYYRDDTITLWHGDATEVLAGMPDGSVDCCVTSPPYFGLRDYGVDGQYGLEASPGEYVETMRGVFAEVRRVLADDGVLWLNLGDSYYSGRGNPGPNAADEKQPARRGWTRSLDQPGATWGRPKGLLQIPERVSIAMGDDQWTLRNKVIWNKSNAMPDSADDRLSPRYEFLFLFSKSRFYWFDLDPIREPLLHPDAADGTRIFGGKGGGAGKVGSSFRTAGGMPNAYGLPRNRTPRHAVATDNTGWKDHKIEAHPKGRNPGDVWTIPTSPFPGAHFATMPPELARRCILSGCKPGGTVLDPFSGSGTTGAVATKLGRRYVGIDLNAEYLDLSLRTRLAQSALADGEAS